MSRNEEYCWWNILPVGILDDFEIISREIEKRNLSPVLEVEELSSEDESKGQYLTASSQKLINKFVFNSSLKLAVKK